MLRGAANLANGSKPIARGAASRRSGVAHSRSFPSVTRGGTAERCGCRAGGRRRRRFFLYDRDRPLLAAERQTRRADGDRCFGAAGIGTGRDTRRSKKGRSKHYGLYPVASLEDRRIAALIDGACLLFAYGGFLALFSSLGGQFTLSKLTAAVYAGDVRDRVSAIFRAVHGVRRHDARNDVSRIAGGKFQRSAAVSAATAAAEYRLRALRERVLHGIFCGRGGMRTRSRGTTAFRVHI